MAYIYGSYRRTVQTTRWGENTLRPSALIPFPAYPDSQKAYLGHRVIFNLLILSRAVHRAALAVGLFPLHGSTGETLCPSANLKQIPDFLRERKCACVHISSQYWSWFIEISRGSLYHDATAGEEGRGRAAACAYTAFVFVLWTNSKSFHQPTHTSYCFRLMQPPPERKAEVVVIFLFSVLALLFVCIAPTYVHLLSTRRLFMYLSSSKRKCFWFIFKVSINLSLHKNVSYLHILSSQWEISMQRVLEIICIALLGRKTNEYEWLTWWC